MLNATDGKIISTHSYTVNRPSTDGDVFVYRAYDETGKAFFTVTRERLAFGGSQEFNGNKGNITLTASGSATFAGTVTAANVTFNLEADGAVLDVKDRLQKADAALLALKTAAAAATDFASLKSAIATALADI